MRSVKFIIYPPEKIKCNICDEWVSTKDKGWGYVYVELDEEDNTFGYPRCEECIRKREQEEDEQT